MPLTIRTAVAADSEALTAISFAAKAHWGYPPEYFAVWRDELTITPGYIEKNLVRVAECDGRIIGYFAVSEADAGFRADPLSVDKGYWLDHIFILPAYIGRGVGSQLIAVLRECCRAQGIGKLAIFADPNASGFYDKLGARRLGEAPSNIAGRTVPLYELTIS